MPPRRKVDHRRGGGGDSKRFSSAEDVKARNNGEETAYEKARREQNERRSGDKVEEGSEEESEEEEVKPKKPAAGPALEVVNPNAVKRNEEKEGVELTRKQREELDKAAARRRYEELHKAGKTDEAKADLARLEEVKKRREEAAKKKADEEAEAKAKEKEKSKSKSVLSEDQKLAMGGEAARVGARSKKDDKDKDDKEEKGGRKIINGVKEELVYSTYITDVKVDKEQAKDSLDTKGATSGSIEACRAAEEDFM
mmetsp:Transcript_41246/g.106715  ORF Transcript_41246/g.106715 Transcript_41246/m.106715 type:complete len:254 (+) Transcript_41246:100-861(+)